MKEPYDEGLASHIGPESCGGGSNGMAEALTGVRAGQVLSREMLSIPGCRRNGSVGRQHLACRYRKTRRTLRGRRPWHVRKHTAREPGDPMSRLWREGYRGRIGKSEDVIQ